MATILITGGTGLVGTRLTELLIAKGYEIIILTRTKKESSEKNISYATWNVEQQTIDVSAIATADYIIHLAGAGVADKRWSEQRKKEIVDSRVQSSSLIVKTLQENNNKVKAVISASAIGWYGADNLTKTNSKKQDNKGFDENAEAANDFLGETCRKWEESIDPITKLGKRLVKLRTGIVLSTSGGALKEFMLPLKLGVASILGDGNQKVSWIHIDDLCELYITAIENDNWQGSYNAVSASPVTNKQLTLALAKQMRGNFFVPIHVPSFALKIMLGEMSIEVLKSCTVSAEKIKKAGYHLMYPTLENALENLIGK